MADFEIHLSMSQLHDCCVRHLFALKFVSNGFVIAVTRTRLPVLWAALKKRLSFSERIILPNKRMNEIFAYKSSTLLPTSYARLDYPIGPVVII